MGGSVNNNEKNITDQIRTSLYSRRTPIDRSIILWMMWRKHTQLIWEQFNSTLAKGKPSRLEPTLSTINTQRKIKSIENLFEWCCFTFVSTLNNERMCFIGNINKHKHKITSPLHTGYYSLDLGSIAEFVSSIAILSSIGRLDVPWR